MYTSSTEEVSHMTTAKQKAWKAKAAEKHAAMAAVVISLMEEHGAGWISGLAALPPPASIATGEAYKGSNVAMLGMGCLAYQFIDNRFGTYKGIQAAGGQVRKGERAKLCVVHFHRRKIEREDKNGEIQAILLPSVRYYPVFNVSQCDGIPPISREDIVERSANVDEFISDQGAEIREGPKPLYSPKDDYISLPPRAFYKTDGDVTATEAYYGAALHELGHWTGHSSRLDRDLVTGYATDKYAAEELIAEIMAALTCQHLGTQATPTPNTARYLNSWIKQLKDKPETILTACTQAYKGLEYLTRAEKGSA